MSEELWTLQLGTVEYREAFDTRVVRTHDPVQTGDHFRVREG